MTNHSTSDSAVLKPREQRELNDVVEILSAATTVAQSLSNPETKDNEALRDAVKLLTSSFSGSNKKETGRKISAWLGDADDVEGVNVVDDMQKILGDAQKKFKTLLSKTPAAKKPAKKAA